MNCEKCCFRVYGEGYGVCDHPKGFIGPEGAQCPLITKIYAYRSGAIHYISVKETAKRITSITRHPAFNYHTIFDKESVCETPEQALMEYKNRLLERIGRHSEVVTKAKEELEAFIFQRNK